MQFLLSFLPIIAWVVLEHWLGRVAALAIGLALGGALLAWRWRKGSLMRFDLAVFAMVLCIGTAEILWTEALEGWTGTIINTALAAYVAITVAIGRPFTEDFARRRTDPEAWETPIFHRINRDISLGWVAVFLIVAALGRVQAVIFGPHSPVGAIITIALIAGAIQLSERYGDWAGERAERQS